MAASARRRLNRSPRWRRSHHVSTPAGWRAARAKAAERFKPDHIRLLLVAEAPPSALHRYFYFPDVTEHDSLFRYVVRLVLGVEPTRSGKAKLLEALRDAGVFLIDLCEDPIASKAELRGCVPGLVERVRRLHPDHLIVIKATVYDAAMWSLREAGLPVVDAMIPFPGSGQQLRFEVEMADALESIGWVAPGLQR